MADKLFRFSATLQINSKARAFAKKSPGATEEAMRRVLRRAEKDARDRVDKGKGPGPHPHNFEHEDTGELALHGVQTAIWLQGFLTEGSVYTDSSYGTYLEVGWRTKAKNFYRYPWLKPAFLESLKYLPKLAAESYRIQMQNFEEDEIVKEASLESWAVAAERWAREMKALERAAPTESPEIPPVYHEIVRQIRHRVMGGRKRGGRPKDTSELGEEMRLNRRRVQQKDDAERQRRAEAAGKFDTKLARMSHRSSEQQHRGEIDPLRAAKEYEKEQARVQAQRDKERTELRRQNAEQARVARERLEAQRKAIRDAAKRAQAAVQPKVSVPKPPRPPSVKSPTKKKKKK